METAQASLVATLTHEQAAVHQGSRFRILFAPESPTEAELIAVTPGRPGRKDARQPFSLTFRGPLTPWHPQGTYPVMHDQLGKMDIFLVPLGPDEQGMCYQAVFS